MTYEQYKDILFSIEMLYDFHPDFFRKISAHDQSVLQQMFLYNYDDTHENDDEYPASIEQYFNELVERNPSICSETIAALSNLYKIAGMGEFSLD